MAMSRKHYRQVADILASELSVRRDNKDAVQAIRCVAFSMADMFKQDNGNFDRDKFYAACGMEQ